MQSLHLSLVTNSGLLLASVPETADETKQILATSILSAIKAFAKEVHRQELQSISYHDRNISFVQVHDFVFIIEILIANLVFSERQLSQILEQIKLSTSLLLEDRNPETITEGEAELILEHCLHDIYNLPLFFTRNPLVTAEPHYFTIFHNQEEYSIENKVGSGDHLVLIAKMISKNKLNEKFKGRIKGFFTLLPKQQFVVFIVIDSDGLQTDVGVLKFPRELEYTIFRLYPLIDKKLEDISSIENKYDMLEILDLLQKFEDKGNRFSKVDIDDLSLSILSKAARSNLESAIHAAVIGDPLIIVGSKNSVKLVIDTLSIFTQHTAVEIKDWNDDRENDFKKEIISQCSTIHGISLDLYSRFKDKDWLDTTTIMELDTGIVRNGNPSFYFMDIFEKNIHQDINKSAVVIFNELRKLVSMAFIFTSLVMYEKEKAQQMLDNLSLQSLYPQSFIRKAIELAKKRNKLLDLII